MLWTKKDQAPNYTEWWGPKEYRYNKIIAQKPEGDPAPDEKAIWFIFWQPGAKNRGPLTLGSARGRKGAEEEAEKLMEFALYFFSLGERND